MLGKCILFQESSLLSANLGHQYDSQGDVLLTHWTQGWAGAGETMGLAVAQHSLPLRALPISLSSFNFFFLISCWETKQRKQVMLPYIGLSNLLSQRRKISEEHRSLNCSLSERSEHSSHEVSSL